MGENVIEVRDMSLCYRLAKQRVGSLKEYMIHMVRASLDYEELWALNEVNLTVGRGEIVGVVGKNGAGKSTLAKVISGVLKPTRGTCEVNGSVSPILELGTGFDHELTGYENIYLNSLLRGQRRKDVDQKIDEIIDFAGVREFIHVPLRNYSTGMVARLGFSVATAWRPDLLILDEVLAVGDLRFVARCHQRIREFRRAGATILLVSHSMVEIIKYCTRCLWIDEGQLKADGDPKGILGHYVGSAEVEEYDDLDLDKLEEKVHAKAPVA